MLNSTDYFPTITSWLSWYSLLCKRMSILLPIGGRSWAFVCPSPQSSLTTGPRFVETPAMTALGRYVTGTRGKSLCGAKTQQGQYPSAKPGSPGRKSRPSIGQSLSWGFLKMPTIEQGRWRTHVSGGRQLRPSRNKLPFSLLKHCTKCFYLNHKEKTSCVIQSPRVP